MPALISRKPQRPLAVTALAAAALIGVSIWLAQSGQSAGTPDVTIATASRGDVTVTVGGGVGRIVTGNVATIELPGSSSSASTTGSTSGSSSSAPADAVFARTTGHIARLLVRPGKRVTAGQALAVIDDNGVSASATRQAQLDLETARVELDQKRRSDPQKGVPPTAAELAAAHASVGSARADLAQVTGRTHAADVAAARADVRRAQADVQALLGGTPAARRSAVALARERATVAQKRLDRVLAPATPTDISAARAEVGRGRVRSRRPAEAACDTAARGRGRGPVRRDRRAGRSCLGAGREPARPGGGQHRPARAGQGDRGAGGAQAAAAAGDRCGTGGRRRREHQAHRAAERPRPRRRGRRTPGTVGSTGRGAYASRRSGQAGALGRPRCSRLCAREAHPGARAGGRDRGPRRRPQGRGRPGRVAGPRRPGVGIGRRARKAEVQRGGGTAGVSAARSAQPDGARTRRRDGYVRVNGVRRARGRDDAGRLGHEPQPPGGARRPERIRRRAREARPQGERERGRTRWRGVSGCGALRGAGGHRQGRRRDVPGHREHEGRPRDRGRA